MLVAVPVSGLLAASPVMRLSTDVSAVPHKPAMTLVALPPSALQVSASQAVSVAKREFALDDSQLDSSVGVVAAELTLGRDPTKQKQQVEIVTADQDFQGPNGVLYHRLCVVVDAHTGAYLYAYTAEPDSTTELQGAGVGAGP